MIVIESGGSKSTWAFYDSDSNSIKYIETVGLHPLEINSEKTKILVECIASNTTLSKKSKVYFYGAGCEKTKGKNLIKELFSALGFKNITVETDLKGACIAHYGKQSGIVGILGTGAIAAKFDGNEIIQKTSGLGCLLGDEGSGFDIGKRLLNEYFYHRIPKNVKQDIEKYFLPEKDIIHRIYQPDGRKVIAGLTTIAKKNIEEKTIQNILNAAFTSFYETALKPFGKIQNISLTGSIAYHFESEVENALKKQNVHVLKIHSSAIKPLFQYHFSSSD